MPDETAPGAPRRLLKPPPAYPGMTIGLMGGSFNPPHAGHLHISRIALNRLGLDRLWWLVTPGNPLKNRSGNASFARRLARAEALAQHPRIDVTGFEAARASVYTADMLGFLTRRFPGVRFIWVMGADNLVTFHHWRNWRDIMALAAIAVIDRPGYRYGARAGKAARCFAHAYVDESDCRGLHRYQPPAWTFLNAPLSGLSSTELRAGGDETR